MKTPQNDPIKLIDRFSVAFLAGLFAFLTVGILWLALAGFYRGSNSIVFLPVSVIWWLTGIMTFLGFFLVENFLINVFDQLWKIIKIFFETH
ncbi:MAG: hypothetical protein ABL884_03035 [Methyloglobulus sp.]